MALTESKTYYGKAWENLEGINGKDDNKNDMKNISKEASKDQKEKPKKDKSSNKKQSSKLTVRQEPVAEKSEVKPVEIIDEAKSSVSASPPVNSLEKSLGTIKTPVDKSAENK